MKIAFVTFEYPPFLAGGAGVYAEKVTKGLINLGHEVTVFTPHITETEDKKTQNLNIIRININENLPFKALQFWLKLPKILEDQHKSKKFNLIHINGISYGFLKKRLLDIPHILTVHHTVRDAVISSKKSNILRITDVSSENNFLLPFIEKKAVKSADKIITVSEFTKKQLAKYYGINDKINVIYNGIDNKNYKNISDDNLIKFKKDNNLLDKKIVLFVGRIDDHRKGLDLLLKSFKRILINLKAVLIVVGSGNCELPIKICKELGILNDVMFEGFVDESALAMYYNLCDVYVCSSRLEGFGLTILEAMASGKPVISTAVGGIPELIKQPRNGTLVHPDNSIQLEKALMSLLKDDNKLKIIGKNNYDDAHSLYSWKKTAKLTENVYLNLIKEY